MNNQKKSGFSLIELMITVAIITIIASFAVPNYTKYVKQTRRSDAYVALLGLAQEQESFYTDKRTYALNLGDIGADDTIRCLIFCKIEGSDAVSPEGYYELGIAPRNGSTIATSFVLTATAKGAQLSDTDCKNITLDSRGDKGATDAGGNSNDDCW